MNTPLENFIRYPVLVAALATFSFAQTNSSPTSKPAALSDEVVALSPFVVSTDSVQGYTATQTLSGTRLRSEARDVGTAMSILTPEFLDDIGATDITSAFDFVPNTETFRVGGDSDPDGNSSRSGNTFTVRGFRSSSLSTNFFKTNLRIDRYNTESFNFNRGPNSILFGAGTPGGLVDASTKQANLRGPRTELELRYSSVGPGTKRATFDQNLSFPQQRAAVRVAGVFQDGSTHATPSRDDRRSLYLAATWLPLKNTSFRINAERGLTERVVGRQYVAFDHYTPWVNAGRPLVTGTTAPATRAGLEANSANYLVKIEGSNLPVMNWGGIWRGSRPQINGAFRTDVSFADESVIPFATNVAGPRDLVQFDYQSYAAFVEQRIGDKFAIEVAANYEPIKRSELMGGRGIDYGVRVDASRTLPDGSPNPFAGMPYIETANYTMAVSERIGSQQSRITASYDFDATRIGTSWFNLGRYKLAGLYSTSRQENSYMNGYEVNLAGTNPDLSNAANRIHRRSYLVPGGPNYFNPAYEPINQPAGANRTAVPAVQSDWRHVLGVARHSLDELSSVMFVTQAHYLKDRIVVTFGIRRDDSSIRGSDYARGTDGQYPKWDQGVWAAPVEGVGHTRTLGAVVHAGRGLSFYVNRSDNFNPPSASAIDIFERAVPPQAGKGLDTGIKFDLFRGKLMGSIGYFETVFKNEAISTLRSVGNKGGAIVDIWEVIDTSQLVTSGKEWSGIRDTASHGLEVQTVLSPTPNWRLSWTLGRSVNRSTKIFPEVVEYINLHRARWLAGASLPATSSFGATVGEVVRYLDDQVALSLAELGRLGLGQREWSSTLVTDYRFPKNSFLDAWNIGSSARWRSEPVIGFKLNATGGFDNQRPFLGKQQTLVDAWIGYRLRVKKSMVNFRLRIENALEESTPYIYKAVDDGRGNPAVTNRLTPTERAYTFSMNVVF